ncbi:hypothetical protein ANO11243_013570 [Dothideomycetidae sp. 11243]|nr:hypothetical protein ANO11243_013570 [fungal sp. No.11243]
MSTASEHRYLPTGPCVSCSLRSLTDSPRAWRGNKPPSLSRPSATQSRSAGASPSVSGATTPVSAQAKPDTSKPLATTKPVEELSAQRKQIPATSPSGNVWDMRKAAAQQHGRATGTTTPRESKPVPLPENKVDTAVSAQGRVPETEERHIPVNGFNSTEVRDFLAGGTL